MWLSYQFEPDVTTTAELRRDIKHLLLTGVLLYVEHRRLILKLVGLIANQDLDRLGSILVVDILHVLRIENFEMEPLDDGYASKILSRDLLGLGFTQLL